MEKTQASTSFVHEGISSGENLEFTFAVGGKGQTGANAGFAQKRKVGENLRLSHPGGQIIEHILRGDAQVANAGLAAPLAGFNRNDAV
jgi:hypothetical protein